MLIQGTLAAALVSLVIAAPAAAQAEADFTPVGYEFCGWLDLVTGGWTYGEPEPGAYLRLFARNQSCRAARRNYKRVRYTQTPPFRPVKLGYRCKTLDSDWEYSDVRCSKKGRSKLSFRWQTGA